MMVVKNAPGIQAPTRLLGALPLPYVTYGRWPEDGKEIVGPVERRPIAPLPQVAHPTRTRFVSLACAWCGVAYLFDLHVGGVPALHCSGRCARKRRESRRRAREHGAPGSFTWAEVVRIYLALGGCAYCGQRTEALEPDHVLPLSKGGSNSITNVVPACRACNCDKRDLLLPEWYADRDRRGLPAVQLNARATHPDHRLTKGYGGGLAGPTK